MLPAGCLMLFRDIAYAALFFAMLLLLALSFRLLMFRYYFRCRQLFAAVFRFSIPIFFALRCRFSLFSLATTIRHCLRCFISLTPRFRCHFAAAIFLSLFSSLMPRRC